VSVLAAQWVRIAGAYDVYIVDRDPRGLALARKLWLGERIDAVGESAAATVRAQHSDRGVDLALVLDGDAERVALARNLVEPDRRILIVDTTRDYAPTDRTPVWRDSTVPIIVASADARTASRFDWETAARTWGSGRLALRDLIAERVPVNELVTRANAGRLSHEGFMVVATQDRG
jgi:threonine dehydrogenase-like Zn-dependent dehydrogenase